MMVGVIWFTLGSVVGAYMAANTTGKLAAGAARASLAKLNAVPEPCRSQAVAALTSFSEADLVRAEMEMFGASPEDAQAAVEKMHLRAGPIIPPEAHAQVSEQQLIDELRLSPEQIGLLRSLRARYRSAPGQYMLTDSDIARELRLSPEQQTRLRTHAQAATVPAPPPTLPEAPMPAEAAGYDFTYGPHGYYDPYAYASYGFALGQAPPPPPQQGADHPYHRYWNHMASHDPHAHQREHGWRTHRQWHPSWGQHPPEPPQV